MNEIKKIHFRPYARLLTMLGDQLIKNECVALIELIKNSYDADATWVKVSFDNFGENYEVKPNSKITIEDNGTGMTEATLINHWANPATPNKKLIKQFNNRTVKGRIIQGEKGIGRFAVLKLGKIVKVATKTQNDIYEHILNYDFSKYEEDFIDKFKDSALFLDDLNIEYFNRLPELFTGENLVNNYLTRKINGSIIEISSLKGSWNEKKINNIYNELVKLTSIFEKDNPDFDIVFYKDSEKLNLADNYKEKLFDLINNSAVIKIENGRFDQCSISYYYEINGNKEFLPLNDFRICGLKLYRDWSVNRDFKINPINCGSFNFSFFIFDLSNNADIKYKLDRDDKKLIKKHRIYLYRDGIRVYPYGNEDNDWLEVDKARSTYRMGDFLSNDQTIGIVSISQQENPMLIDKTNREGLVEVDNVTNDFSTILKLFLAYIRQYPYNTYRESIVLEEKQKKKNVTSNLFTNIKDEIEKLDNKKISEMLNKLESSYLSEKESWEQRFSITEDLAGVGLSVETSSHDLMATISKVNTNHFDLIRYLQKNIDLNKNLLIKELTNIQEAIEFIKKQLSDMQLLFRSSKQKRKNILVISDFEKIKKLFDRVLKKNNIYVDIIVNSPDLIAFATDAVLLQVFLNLFDNSVYWLQDSFIPRKEINILFDGKTKKVIFADNGPGINEKIIPYIFEPFFSGKGDEGRGLGLYIARQLLKRCGYSIDVAKQTDNILSGANFVIDFSKGA